MGQISVQLSNMMSLSQLMEQQSQLILSFQCCCFCTSVEFTELTDDDELMTRALKYQHNLTNIAADQQEILL